MEGGEKMKRTIEPIFLVGDEELGQAIGITTPRLLQELRQQGMPYYICGKSFVYDPEEVKKFLKKLWSLANNKKEVKLKL